MIIIKSIIEYFYKMFNIELHRRQNIYDFKFKEDNYIFVPLSRSEEELMQINQIIKSNSSLYDQLVLNIENHYITQTQKGYFVLIKRSTENLLLKEAILLQSKNAFQKGNYPNIDRSNWLDLWSKKIDYIEYQLLHIGNKFPIISKSIDYYIGMSETAISYLNDIISSSKNDFLQFTVSHKRISKDSFNNPMNIIIDYRARDISEYLKYIFIENEYDYDEISIFLQQLELTELDCKLIYARLLYPSFYFDLYDQVISDLAEEKKVLSILKRNKEYEDFIKVIYNLLNEKARILEIDWV